MATISEHIVTYASGKKQINYLATGPTNGPLLIFLHGWPAIASTWKPQLTLFASLGFRAVAPDMPGYGKSTANHVITDYCHETIIQGLLALLSSTGRDQAIWLGHDWSVLSPILISSAAVCD